MLTTILALMSVLLGQEQPRVRPNVGPDQEHLKYEEGFRPTRSGYIMLMIPRPIQTDEWRRYGDILRLSEEQRAALAEPFDRYRRADWAFRMDKAQPLRERSADISPRVASFFQRYRVPSGSPASRASADTGLAFGTSIFCTSLVLNESLYTVTWSLCSLALESRRRSGRQRHATTTLAQGGSARPSVATDRRR